MVLFVILQNSSENMQIILIIAGLIAGAAIATLIMMSKFSAAGKQKELKVIEADRELGILNDRLEQLMKQYRSTIDDLNVERKNSTIK